MSCEAFASIHLTFANLIFGLSHANLIFVLNYLLCSYYSGSEVVVGEVDEVDRDHIEGG